MLPNSCGFWATGQELSDASGAPSPGEWASAGQTAGSVWEMLCHCSRHWTLSFCCSGPAAFDTGCLSGSQSNTSSFPCPPSGSTWTPGATQPLLLAHGAQSNLCPADDSGRCCGLAKAVFVGSCASDHSAGHSHHPGSPEWTSRATFAEELGKKKSMSTVQSKQILAESRPS